MSEGLQVGRSFLSEEGILEEKRHKTQDTRHTTQIHTHEYTCSVSGASPDPLLLVVSSEEKLNKSKLLGGTMFYTRQKYRARKER